MSLDTRAMLDAIRSVAMTTGHFERVEGHDPANAPGHGLTFAVWRQRIRPVLSSGLASTSALVLFKIRIFASVLQQPVDEIDPAVDDAADDLLTEFSANLDLDLPNVRSIDVFGAEGFPLTGEAGYVSTPDGEWRVFDLDLPVIVNDVWPQAR